MKQVFQGELMLLRWSETSSGGATITFQLSDANDLLPFKDMTLAKGKQAGQILTAVIVDAEGVTSNLVESHQIKELSGDAKPFTGDVKPKGGDLARMAGVFCNDPVFWEFLDIAADSKDPVERAAHTIRKVCCVKSRVDLDHSGSAALDFHRLFRTPFLAYKEARK